MDGCTLCAHDRGYKVSLSDAGVFLLTGCGGVPYAMRHWSLSNTDPSNRLGHRAVAVLHAIPGLGAVTGLAERIVVHLTHRDARLGLAPGCSRKTNAAAVTTIAVAGRLPSGKALANLHGLTSTTAGGSSAHSRLGGAAALPIPLDSRVSKETVAPGADSPPLGGTGLSAPSRMLRNTRRSSHMRSRADELAPLKWTPRLAITPAIALAKMQKNALKALTEHTARHPFAHYVSAVELLAEPTLTAPIRIICDVEESDGGKSYMEDTHLIIEDANYTLACVFDGHGGSAVSSFLKDNFYRVFSEVSEIYPGNLFVIFEVTIDALQKQIFKEHPEWDKQGSTAIISFITKLGVVITVTLGDSEAFKITSGAKIAPLSCVRDFGCSKDFARTGLTLDAEDEAERLREPKQFRVINDSRLGSAVSRSLGDYTFHMGSKHLITHKPKISIGFVKPGDKIYLGSDGIWDNISIEQLRGLYSASTSTARSAIFAEALSATARAKAGDRTKIQDNLTLISIVIS